MTDLHSVLAAHVENGSVPGAVGLVARASRCRNSWPSGCSRRSG